MSSQQQPAGSQTLDRGIRLLEFLAGRPRGLTLTEISRELSINRTALHRMVETLMAHQLLERDADKRIRLGPGLVALAAAVNADLTEIAHPVLTRLAEDAHATAYLMVQVNAEEVQASLVVEPRNAPAHIAFRAGQRHPLTRGSGGISILSLRPPADSDPDEVVTARRLGYAVSSSAIIPNVTGVGAPIRTPGHLPTACLGVSLVDPSRVSAVAPLVVEAAAEVERLLRGADRGRG